MKLRTRIMLNSIKDINVNNYLKEQLDLGSLNDKQVQYLIKVTNTNRYILQNAIPVAEAMKNDISIETIEYVASILKDACDQSCFALESGKGNLFNKVPDQLEHLLNLENTKYLSTCKVLFDGEFDNEVIKLQKEKLDLIVDVYNTSNELNTTNPLKKKEFWDLLTMPSENGDKVNKTNCESIQKYNISVSEYFNSNLKQEESFLTKAPYVEDLISNGIKAEQLGQINFSKLEIFQENIIKNSEKLFENDTCNKIKYEIDQSDYCLTVEEVINVKLVPDYELGAREETFKDTLISFQNKEKENDNNILMNSNYDNAGFISKLFIFAENEKRIEKHIINTSDFNRAVLKATPLINEKKHDITSRVEAAKLNQSGYEKSITKNINRDLKR